MRLVEFEFYKDLLRDRSGLMVTPDQATLLTMRLTPVSRAWGYPSLSSMNMAMKILPDEKLVSAVIEAMTDPQTAFFRDHVPFAILHDIVIPGLLGIRSKKEPIKIWSAGCATGEEPYSIAIMLKEMGDMVEGRLFDIVGTDISPAYLERARSGHYSHSEAQHGLAATDLLNYFTRAGKDWKINPKISSMVRFETHNLMQLPKHDDAFDVIFCRNVINGMDPTAVPKVLKNLSACLAPDGVIFLGREDKVPEGSDILIPAADYPNVYVTAKNHWLFESSGRPAANPLKQGA